MTESWPPVQRATRTRGFRTVGALGVVAALALAGIAPAAAADGNDLINVPDAALRTCVTEALGLPEGDEISRGDVAALTEFECRSKGVVSLEGLQHFTGLTKLDLRSNRIDDLSPLAGLTSLRQVWLNINSINDVGHLSDLTQLKSLWLHHNDISDIAPLSSLDLHELGLNNNNVANATALAGMTSLYRLQLESNQLTSIDFLENLTGLRDLLLSSNPVTDFAPIENLTSLESLWLNDTGMHNSDMTFLSGLEELDHLRINSNGLSDLGPIENLASLAELWATNNNIADLGPLAGLESLDHVRLDNNRITDVSPLPMPIGNLNVTSQHVDLGDLTVGVPFPNPVRGFEEDPVPLDGVAYDEDGNTFTPATSGSSTATWNVDRFSGSLNFTLAPLEDLQITTTAEPAYDHRYEWVVALDGDDAVVPDGQQTAEVDYEATLTPTLTSTGFRVNGTITVTNPNAVDIDDVTVTSALDSAGASCEAYGGTDLTVPAEGSVDVYYGCDLPDDTPTDAAVTQTATATWDTGESAATATADFGDFQPAFAYSQYRYLLDPVHQDVVFDAEEGPQTFAFTKQHEIPEAGQCGEVTATFAIGDDGVVFEDATATVTVCTEASLQVSKNPTATFDRQYLWEIEKSVTTDGVVDERNEARFDYVVQVDQDGFVDSNWMIEGEIEVTNPNTFGQITFDLAQATDLDEAQCIVDGEHTAVVLAGGETVAMAYVCTLGVAPEYETTSTATVTWIDAAGELASASGSAEANFEVAAEIDAVVEVWDDHTDPANPILLGEADRTDEESWLFPYSLILQGEVGETTQFTNTAWIEVAGENPQASTTVEIVIDPLPETRVDAEPEARPAMPATGAPLAGLAALALLCTVGGLAVLGRRNNANLR